LEEKKMKKRWIKLCAAVLVLALLMPVYREADDGGTREYAAVLYRIRLRHTMTRQENVCGYMTGTEVNILGIEVYSDVRFVCGE
jgi:hypothetical protein